MKKRAENWIEAFLTAYRETGNVSHAAREAGTDRTTIYKKQKASKTFALTMEEAEKEATETLEYEAYRRAVKGTERPVFYKGEECGTVQEYSDGLLIVLLKARAPEKYRENIKQEISGPGGGPIPIREIVVRRQAEPEEDA